MSYPTPSGLGALIMGSLAFIILAAAVFFLTGCADTGWKMSTEPDLTRPVDEMRFRAEVGGRF